MKLSELGLHIHALIKSVSEPVLAEKLKERGIFEGSTVEIIGYAPGGCPLIIESGGVKIGIRKTDAVLVTVKNIE